MIIVRSPKWALISVAVSLAIFLILYFAVIQPGNDSANHAVEQGEKQVQQSVNQAASGGGIPAGVTNLANCIAAAGTNATELQACAAKFKKQ